MYMHSINLTCYMFFSYMQFAYDVYNAVLALLDAVAISNQTTFNCSSSSNQMDTAVCVYQPKFVLCNVLVC